MKFEESKFEDKRILNRSVEIYGKHRQTPSGEEVPKGEPLGRGPQGERTPSFCECLCLRVYKCWQLLCLFMPLSNLTLPHFICPVFFLIGQFSPVSVSEFSVLCVCRVNNLEVWSCRHRSCMHSSPRDLSLTASPVSNSFHYDAGVSI